MPGTGSASRGQLHVHAVTTAAIATPIAQRANAAVEVVHLAALLHDVGKLVMPLAFGDEALRRHWLGEVRARLSAGEPGGVLIGDVDNFKAINDGHGHRVGDLVLSEVAAVLARHGFAGRLGGDEFGIWAPGGEREALACADAILRDVERDVAIAGDGVGTVTLSIGAAIAPRDRTDVTPLLETADGALYRAMAAGRRRAHLAGM